MILDDGGDATCWCTRASSTRGRRVPDPTEDDPEEWRVVLGVLNAPEPTPALPKMAASRASPRRPPPACTASTR
jgi:hypothetical protein